MPTVYLPKADRYAAGVSESPDAATVDLLGLLACGELFAFERLARDASLAPALEDKAELGGMAVAEFNHFTLLRQRLTDFGVDATAAMTPFVQPLTEFHARTAPADWLEGLVKAYVGDAIAADFYREIAVHLDDSARDLVLSVLADTGHASFVVDRVRQAIAADARVGGRLALWGRRLIGEVLSQAQRVAVERESLASLIIGSGRPGLDLVEIGRMFGRLTEAHTKRMAALGLSA